MKGLEQSRESYRQSVSDEHTHAYFEACRIVRRQRKEILGLISKAITDNLGGHMPPKGSLLEIVYENVENLRNRLNSKALLYWKSRFLFRLTLLINH